MDCEYKLKKKDEHLLLDHFRGIKFLKVFFLSIDKRNSESKLKILVIQDNRKFPKLYQVWLKVRSFLTI